MRPRRGRRSAHARSLPARILTKVHGITTRQFVGSIFGASFLGATAAGQDQDRGHGGKSTGRHTIVLLRHAESAPAPKEDPKLTTAGEARAQRLLAMLGQSGITHLFATELSRTQLTVAPLAAKTKVVPQIVSARDTEALVRALMALPHDSVAVVAGHSNTVPALLAKLTGEKRITIGEAEFDRLFIVTRCGAAEQSLALELRY